MYSNAFKHLHLDPAPDGAAGGAAASGSPVGGDAAPAFDASQYVPKAEFDQIRNDYSEFRQSAEQRFQDYDSRLPKQETAEPKADVAPKVGDYDFNKEGEFERFIDDRNKFTLRQEFSQRETQQKQQQGESQYRESVQKALSSHAERQDAYKALNPDYDPFKNVAIGNEAVTLEILNSDYSAQIHHYFQKNPDKLTDLRKLARENPGSAVRMIGRIEAQFESQAATITGKKSAATASPTSDGFGGKLPSGNPKKSDQEIFDEFHK
jgi:hypothetical protein